MKNTQQPIRLLHLSDFHFRADKRWDADPVLRSLARFIGDEVKNGLVSDLVVITGDLAYGGKEEEYGIARDWLENRLWPELPASFSRHRLLVVPGNHDVDRDKVDFIAEATQKELLSKDSQDHVATVVSKPEQRDVLLKRHAAYLEFLADWMGEKHPVPWWQQSVDIRGQRLHLAGLDSAWMSWGDNDRNSLLLGLWQINEV